MPKNATKVENKKMLKIHQNHFLVQTMLQKCEFIIVNQHQKCFYSSDSLQTQY